MNNPRAKKRFLAWILGCILLGATINQFLVAKIHPAQLGLSQWTIHTATSPSDDISPTTHDDAIHIVFSTGCSESQNLQSYLFFYRAMQVKQPGMITRIASGCDEAQQQDVGRRHEEQVFDSMSNNFHIHFTPDYSTAREGKVYHYFNKAFGLHHWMKHALGFPANRSEHAHKIFAVFDPDMILLKPLLNNFDGLPQESWKSTKPDNKTSVRVRRGHPMAQYYSYVTIWRNGLGKNLDSILGKSSPVYNVSMYDTKFCYPAGPPYMLEAWDLFEVVSTWSAIAPFVHENHPYILSEMFAYSIAAAHHKLKHHLVIGLTAYDLKDKEGGWKFLDDVGSLATDACDGQHNAERVPYALHYYETYTFGNYSFSKTDLPNNVFSCESSLLPEPPRESPVTLNGASNDTGKHQLDGSTNNLIRNAFMTCTLLSFLNQAATFYKQHQCGPNANFNKSGSFRNWSTS